MEIFSWERLLVIWGLIAPAAGAYIAHRWEKDKLKQIWERESNLLENKYEFEEKARTKKEEQDRENDIQKRMEESYSIFLSNGAKIVLGVSKTTNGEKIDSSILSEFSVGFQRLLLIASNESAKVAVEIWNKTSHVATESLSEEEKKEVVGEIKTLRTAFIREARKDLSDPITRNSNPGIKIEPALQIGGFGLTDVG